MTDTGIHALLVATNCLLVVCVLQLLILVNRSSGILNELANIRRITYRLLHLANPAVYPLDKDA